MMHITKHQTASEQNMGSAVDDYRFSLDEVANYSITKESDFEATFGEKALWRAVITQALMDAGSQSQKTEILYEQRRAVSWLSGLSEDFHAVCLLADLEPSYVRQKSHDAIARGCTWRKDIRLKERLAKLKGVKKNTQVEIPIKDKAFEIVLIAF